MNLKKGQYASNAAAFIAILMVLIVLYILFLPPDVRTELLGDKKGTTVTDGTDSTDNSILLKETVGRVSFVNTNEKTYDLPATRINSPTSGQILKSITSISLLHALLDREKAAYEIDFGVDRDATKNALLSFTIKNHRGPLIAVLNGREIFNAEITQPTPKPIALDQEYLDDTNKLTLSVPSPGWAFWSVNKYELEAIQITADVTDYSNSEAVQYFTLSQAQVDNLENVRLFFYPNCKLSDVSSLRIDLNRRTIYNSVADCGTRTFAVLDKEDIIAGSNELKFYSNKGSYTLDNMYVKVTLNEPTYPTYFFELKDDYFISKDVREDCGDYDGVCPAGCDETLDADCCQSNNGFWCALSTLNVNDRCLFYVGAGDCTSCKTGYYDTYGDVPENCENRPGDNNDDACLSSTTQPSRYYDKDCCFAANTDNFWCEEVPLTGLADKCKANINPSECDLCPSGYENDDGSAPDSCDTASYTYTDQDHTLSSQYEVKLTVRFVNDRDRKRVDFNVNGYKFRIDTRDIESSKAIDEYVRKGTNSIEIIPVEDDIEIAELKIEFRRVK